MGGMGGMSGMGGMGGAASKLNFGDPRMSKMIQNSLPLALPFMGRVFLYKKIDEAPTGYVKREGVKRVRLMYGPLKVRSQAEKKKMGKMANPLGMDPLGTSWYSWATDFPTGISILRSNVTLKYEDGSVATVSSGIYDHHAVFLNANKAADALFKCPDVNPAPSIPVPVIAAAGEDGGATDFITQGDKLDTGLYVWPKDRIFFAGEIVNYTNNTKEVFAEVDMEYLPRKTKFDTSAENLSVAQCEKSGVGIRPPAGKKKFHLASKKMIMQKDGYIFNARGHLHDGGDHLQLILNGKVICDSQAKYGGSAQTNGAWQTIGGMTGCPKNVRVKKGDALTIESFYDLERHPSRDSGGESAEQMGIAILKFAFES